MTTFDDLKAWLDERDAQQEDLVDGLQQQVTRLSESEAALRSENTRLNGEVDRLTLALEACEETPDPEPEPEPERKVILGMSAPFADWPARISEVGRDGITARRIFADFMDGAQDQKRTIDAAVADGMIPVISYKIGGQANIDPAIRGELDDEARAAAAFLKSYNKPMYLAVWHEPNGDMTGPQFVALSQRLLPIFRSPLIKVGCFLNGWQLTAPNQMDAFKAYTSKALLDNVFDFFGIDSYQNPDRLDTNPGDRIPPLQKVLSDLGHPGFPIAIGEYNAHTAADVTEAGEVFLSAPNMEFFMMWNANGSGSAQARVLVGDRLEAFKRTKMDPRVAR